MNEKAIELIALYDHHRNKNANFLNLYQETANLIFPRESDITVTHSEGEEKGRDIIDPTGQMASIEMASGLSINLFPPGQKFYNITMSDGRLNEVESVKRTLGFITEISHEKRANSNFMLQSDETLRGLSVFGEAFMFSDWTSATGLNYTDYDIADYIPLENSKGIVDTVLFKTIFTASQAHEEFGDKAGETVIKKMENLKTQSDKFEFIYIIRPRIKRNLMLQDTMNLPFELICISVTDKEIVKEGGYHEFPGAVPRWSKSSKESRGRGQGVFALPFVRNLQKMHGDLIECGNLWNNSPKEVLDTFEGEVRTFAGALNWVPEMGSIKAIEQGVRGNFPITKDLLEYEQELVKRMFFNDVFVQLRDLKGDRRTTLEIRALLAEGLQRLGPPIGRIQTEWLNPVVTRDILLLIRNGELPPLPREMQGQKFKIEYVGRLAMELKSQQARGFQQWAMAGAEFEQVFPGSGVLDNVNIDGGYRRLGETLGVSIEDMTSEEERNAKRQARAEAQQRQEAMQMAQIAAQGLGQTSKKPERDSPAEKVMESMGV